MGGIRLFAGLIGDAVRPSLRQSTAISTGKRSESRSLSLRFTQAGCRFGLRANGSVLGKYSCGQQKNPPLLLHLATASDIMIVFDLLGNTLIGENRIWLYDKAGGSDTRLQCLSKATVSKRRRSVTREFVMKRIDECKSRLDALGLQAANQGDFELPLAIEQYRNELDRAFKNRCRSGRLFRLVESEC